MYSEFLRKQWTNSGCPAFAGVCARVAAFGLISALCRRCQDCMFSLFATGQATGLIGQNKSSTARRGRRGLARDPEELDVW